MFHTQQLKIRHSIQNYYHIHVMTCKGCVNSDAKVMFYKIYIDVSLLYEVNQNLTIAALERSTCNVFPNPGTTLHTVCITPS